MTDGFCACPAPAVRFPATAFTCAVCATCGGLVPERGAIEAVFDRARAGMTAEEREAEQIIRGRNSMTEEKTR